MRHPGAAPLFIFPARRQASTGRGDRREDHVGQTGSFLHARVRFRDRVRSHLSSIVFLHRFEIESHFLCSVSVSFDSQPNRLFSSPSDLRSD